MIKDVYPSHYSVLALGRPGVGKFEYSFYLTKSALQRGEKVIFVTADRSPQEIRGRLQGAGLDMDALEGNRFLFVDVFSRSASGYPKALHVENPANLNLISVKISQAAEQLGKPVRIFFDSLSNLFFRLSPPEIIRFLEMLTAKVETEYGFILYTLQEGMHDDATVTAIKHITDCTIEMKIEEAPTFRRKFRMPFAKGMSPSQDWFEFSIDEFGFREVSAKTLPHGQAVKPEATPIIRQPARRAGAPELKRENGIILAMDVEERERALAICREAIESVDAIKVGYPLILKEGISVLDEIKALGKPVIADLKVADIPEISARICGLARAADYVIIHGFVGEDVVMACSEVARIFVVAEMSHPGSEEFIARCSAEVAAMAKKYAPGIVAPATRPGSIKRLRKIVGGLTIISPGIKAQGAKPGDALRAGADYEIVGRGIYLAKDPRKAAEEFSRVAREIIAQRR